MLAQWTLPMLVSVDAVHVVHSVLGPSNGGFRAKVMHNLWVLKKIYWMWQTWPQLFKKPWNLWVCCTTYKRALTNGHSRLMIHTLCPKHIFFVFKNISTLSMINHRCSQESVLYIVLPINFKEFAFKNVRWLYVLPKSLGLWQNWLSMDIAKGILNHLISVEEYSGTNCKPQ